MFHGKAEDVLKSGIADGFRGNVQLIFTSPPFPLNRKKRYGNLTGDQFVDWLAAFGSIFKDILAPNGSIVIEMGNSWVPNEPVMSIDLVPIAPRIGAAYEIKEVNSRHSIIEKVTS